MGKDLCVGALVIFIFCLWSKFGTQNVKKLYEALSGIFELRLLFFMEICTNSQVDDLLEPSGRLEKN